MPPGEALGAGVDSRLAGRFNAWVVNWYSAIRDWNLGDVDRRDLRPKPGDELTGVGRWMHEIAVRDEEAALAEGIAHLFGKAECPRCASVFTIADEYEAANRPVLR